MITRSSYYRFVSILHTQDTARRNFLQTTATVGATLLLPTAPAFAELEVPPQSTEYTFPTDWGLTFKYEEDAAKVRKHMLIATALAKGAPDMEDFGKNLKKEMVDFVSYYRRFPKVAGKPSFSNVVRIQVSVAGKETQAIVSRICRN